MENYKKPAIKKLNLKMGFSETKPISPVGTAS